MYLSTSDIDNIIEKMSDRHLNLLLVAENSGIDIENLIKKSNDAGLKIVGGIFPGLIYDVQNYDKGLVIKQLDSDAEVVLSTGLEKGNFTDSLPSLDAKFQSAIILVDGLTTGIPAFLEHVYEQYGSQMTYVGGGCGSLTLQQKPCLFTNHGQVLNAALMILQPNVVSVGVKHGWKKVAGPFIANSSNGNTLKEMNWEPAFDVYKREIEKYSKGPICKDNFFDIAKAFPFGIYREGYEDVVRDPILTSEDKSLTCVGEISNNTVINILEGDPEVLIQSAKDATILALDNADKDFRNIFLVDCISRVLYLEGDFEKELLAVKDVLSQKSDILTLEGVLSLGEISSYGDGYVEFFNKTIVVSTTT